MKIFKELELLGFFEWLAEMHNLRDTDMKPEYLDELPLNDIHLTVGNSMAFRWFRDKHGLMHIINPYYFTAEINYLNKRVVDTKYGDFIPHDHLVNEEGEEIKYSSYEEAETACLIKLIEIAKETK